MIKNLLIFLIMVSQISFAEASTFNCKNLLPKVKQASQYILGIDFPWWYNLGQIETESNCLWHTSLDGIGSVGYAQITPKFWDKILKTLFPNWKIKNHTDHFLSQAYIIKKCLQQAFCSNLWNAYQCYNRNCMKVNQEAFLSQCNYLRAYKICNLRFSKNICVWKKNSMCLQYRSNCEINYEYSYKIWKNGKKYREGLIEKSYRFW